MNQNNLHCTILVIGGCQITGYPFHFEKSFISALAERLDKKGFEHKMIVYPYTTLNKPERIQKLLLDVKPDFLLMQCGHFEFQIDSPLRKLNRLLKAKSQIKKSSKSIKNLESLPNSASSFKPGIRYRTLQMVKHLANHLFGYCFYHKDKWAKYISASFSVIKNYGPQCTLVLEPFPCANVVTNNYRKKGAALLKVFSEQYDFNYAEGIAQYLQQALGNHFFTDELHINEQAHQVLGEWVFNETWRIIKKEIRKDVNQHLSAYVPQQENTHLPASL